MAKPANTYTPSSSGLRDLGGSHAVGDQALAAAQDGARYAQAIAPRLTGRYQGSIHAERADVTVAGEVRSGAQIVVDPLRDGDKVSYAVPVERSDHVLKRTIDYLESRG